MRLNPIYFWSSDWWVLFWKIKSVNYKKNWHFLHAKKTEKLRMQQNDFKMNISAETSVDFISDDYDSSYDYDFSGEPFDFRIKELLIPRNELQEVVFQ